MLPLLFSPFKFGRIEIRNRIVMTPTATHLPEAAHLEFYLARARGGVGLIQLAPGIVDANSHYDTATALYDDKFVPALARLVTAVHAEGAAISIQLWHAGRQLEIRNLPMVAPSPISYSRTARVPRELSIPEIEELVEKFARAALRARQAGVDFVEIHGAHGYLVSEFLSPWSNKRTDKYGGDVAGRTRFVVEIIRRIKELAGADFPVSCRINGADNVRGGATIDEAKAIAPVLVAAGLDIISVSAGVYGSYPTIIPPYDTPQGCYVPLAAAIKSAVTIPVIAAGRINDPRLAEEVLKAGKADLVGMARALIADPALPNKAQHGEFDQIRKCIACNTCNDAIDGGPVRCTVNPAVGKEKELVPVPAARKKKVMVIGSGPAGMQAAIVAAQRGHSVSLYEKEAQLGGQWRLAAVPPHKADFLELVNYQSRQLTHLGVSVQLGQEVSLPLVEVQQPDVVVVATGALPASIAGCEAPGKVITAWDVLRGTVATGKRVLVVGGGSVGLETAHFLAERGKQVSVIEMTEKVGMDMGETMRYHLLYRLKALKVRSITATRLKRVTERGITVIRNDAEEVWTEFDTVVLAVGARPANELAGALKGKVKELYVIGDAVSPRRGVNAVVEGATIGCSI